MKIENLTLIGYKRLMLNNINKIIYTPSTDLQIILGTNGSGKSSLLKELSVFPAQSNDFTKEGSKTVIATHNHHRYKVESSFQNGSKHYFYKDEVNLNPGGTSTVQKELIKQEFGITQDIHNLMVGITKFTGMTPTQRRQLITIINPSDLTFATKTFNETRTFHRDALGAFKHIQTRLSVEVNKLANYVDMDELEMQVRQLQAELTLLMENRELGLPGIWEIETSITTHLQRLETIAAQTLKLTLKPPSMLSVEEAKHITNVEQHLTEIRQQLSIAESIHAHYSTEYAELDSVVSSLGVNSESSEELEERLHNLEAEESFCLEKIINHLIETNAEEVRNDTIAVLEQVVPMLTSLPRNPNRRYNPTQYVELKDLYEETLTDCNRLTNRKAQLENRKDHIEAAKDINCPKCNYVWKPGISENEIVTLETNIANIDSELSIKHSLLKKQQTLLTETEEYSIRLKAFNSLCNSYPRLQNLWNAIAVDSVLFENPEAAVGIISEWHSDVRHSYTLSLLRSEMRTIKETLQHIRLVQQNDSSHVTERIEVLRENIEIHTNKINLLRGNKKELEAYRNSLLQVAENKAEIHRLIQQVVNEQAMLQKILRDQSIVNVIGTHQTALALGQTRLNEKQTIQGIINDLKESLDTVSLEKMSYQLLMEALSPVDGLIAESLMDCIHSIVVGLNAIIGAVWTKPLIIQDCKSLDGELDYKFGMLVGDVGNPVPDISDGSSAQLDIINFAFTVLVYAKLNLQNFPLYLDELGKTFDEQHKTNIMYYVKECLEAHQFSQIFFISHDAAQYGGFSNSETLVLDGTNVSVPLIHNQHVIME